MHRSDLYYLVSHLGQTRCVYFVCGRGQNQLSIAWETLEEELFHYGGLELDITGQLLHTTVEFSWLSIS